MATKGSKAASAPAAALAALLLLLTIAATARPAEAVALVVSSTTRSPNTTFVLRSTPLTVTTCLATPNGAGATVRLIAVPSSNAVVSPATNVTGTNGCATFSATFNSAGDKNFTVNATKAGFDGAVATGQAPVKVTRLLISLSTSSTPLYVNTAFTVTARVDTAVASFTTTTVTISSPNGGLSCTGSTTKTASATTGVASFGGCRFDATGNKTIIAVATTSCGAGCGLPQVNTTLAVRVAPIVLDVGCPAATLTSLTPSNTFPGGAVNSDTTLVLTQNGVYTISSTLVPAANVTLCVLAGTGVTSATVVLGGSATSHVSLNNTGAKLALRGLTLRGSGSTSVLVKACSAGTKAVADATVFDTGGSALNCEVESALSFKNALAAAAFQGCTFTNFKATAVYLDKRSSAVFTSTTLFANNSAIEGGAIKNGRVSLQGTVTFSSNRAIPQGLDDSYGGAVTLVNQASSLEFSANAVVSFTDNQAGSGGAIAVQDGSIVVQPGAVVTFKNNRALGGGAELYGGGAIALISAAMTVKSGAKVCLQGNTVGAGDPVGGEISLLLNASLIINGTVSSAGTAFTPGIVFGYLIDDPITGVNSTVSCGGVRRSSVNSTLSFFGDVCASSCQLSASGVCSCPAGTTFDAGQCACAVPCTCISGPPI